MVPEEESGIVADKRDARFNEKQEEETGEGRHAPREVK